MLEMLDACACNAVAPVVRAGGLVADTLGLILTT